MNHVEEAFIPDDPDLYGPVGGRPATRGGHLKHVLGLSATQSAAVIVVALLVFAFLGGPFWSAARQAFPLRLVVSYLIMPLMVLFLLWWNSAFSWRTAVFTSAVLGGIKLVVTVAMDIAQGLLRHWPP